MKKSVALALVLVSGSLTGTALASTDGSVLLPNTFTAGTPALAEQVNANFAALQGAANASNSRLTTAEGTIANHTSGITNNANNISAVAANVATNTADIGSKQTRVSGSCPSGNSIRVINGDGSVVCQADTVGGVTGVTAGTGLSGGGTTGDVTLFIPNGGITASHIANGSVGTLTIADGAVASGNIATGAVGSAAIADGSIASVDIAAGAITASHLATGAVGTAAIADNSITAVKIANEAGISYSGGGYAPSLTLATCPTSTSLLSVTVTVPSGGYIHVTASGSFCTYTAGVTSELVLDDAPGGATLAYDGFNYAYDYSSSPRGCSMGQTPFAFENVYSVGPGTYTYYVNGCASPAGSQTLVLNHPMVATFYPTHY